MGIHAGGAACSVAANELLIFPQPIAIYKEHSPGILHSLQVSEQGQKPPSFDTPLWLPSSPLPFSPVPYAPQEFLNCLNTSMQPEREMRTGVLGQAGVLREQREAENWTGFAAASNHPCPPPPVGTPLLLVQPLLSKCSCDIEWPSVGLEILMMTARWYVLNKAVSAAQPGDPCGILTASSVGVSIACRVGESS